MSRLLRNAGEKDYTEEHLQHRLSLLSTRQLQAIVVDIEADAAKVEPHEDLIRAELASREAS
jgi:hypothetical protein